MAELFDMEFDGFLETVREIEGQGFDEATAARYACLIGDTPALDVQGNVVVMDGDKVLARLKLQSFGCEEKPLYIEGDVVPPNVAAQAKLPAAQFARLQATGRLDDEASQVGQLLANAYNLTFDNLDEFALPEIMFEHRFDCLLAMALKRGQALTEAEVKAAFPNAAWEY